MPPTLLAALIVGTLGPAVHAVAAPSTIIQPAVCDPGGGGPPYYAVSNVHQQYLRDRSSRIYGDSGVTLTITKGTGWTFTATATGATSAEAGILLAKASATFSLALAASRSSSTTYAGSWTVPRSQDEGWLEIGTVQGYRYNWEKYHYASPCTKVVEKHGVATAPTKTSNYKFAHS